MWGLVARRRRAGETPAAMRVSVVPRPSAAQGLAVSSVVRRREAPPLPPTRALAEVRLRAERLRAERLRAERLRAERRQAERLRAERLRAERLRAERLRAERRQAERLRAERRQAERRQAERLRAERRQAERRQAERRQAERRQAAPMPARTRASETARMGQIRILAPSDREATRARQTPDRGTRMAARMAARRRRGLGLRAAVVRLPACRRSGLGSGRNPLRRTR